MKEKWFGEKKPELIKTNSCINLPFVLSGGDVVTQSNTCAVYLGRKLGIDTEINFVKNHTVLDQAMDLRNDLMMVVYPFGNIKTKDAFPEGAKKHLAGSATTNFTKLEGFCAGPYMCGAAPESGDFFVFEMLDQHLSIAESVGEVGFLDKFPKLKSLHSAMKGEASLGKYFESDQYVKWAQNNGLMTHYTGQGEDFVYGMTVEELFEPAR
jgi:glutathione S-transferase